MHTELHSLLDYVSWWVFFWSMVNILLPPRETFANCSDKIKRRYNTFLILVSYYGSLNLRQIMVKAYGVESDREKLEKDMAAAQTVPVKP